VGSPYIRPFEPRDREAVADICVRTAQHGEDARGHLASPELYAEIWALPYVDLAPELAFVLDAGDGSHRAIGYVLGVEDTASFRERAEREWFPAARARHPRRPAEDPRDLWLLEILHGEPEPVPPFWANAAAEKISAPATRTRPRGEERIVWGVVFMEFVSIFHYTETRAQVLRPNSPDSSETRRSTRKM